MRSSQQQPRRHRQAKRGPTPCTPIPAIARPIVEAVHRRYLNACNRGERPAIDDPTCLAGLVTTTECAKLAESGYWPLPPEIMKVGMTPAERRRQAFLDALAEQLPDAVKVILESMT